VVTRTLELQLQRGSNVVNITLPAEADPGSFFLFRRRGGVELERMRWGESDSPAETAKGEVAVSLRPQTSAPCQRLVQCTLYSAVQGRVGVEMVYLVTGLSWRTDYRLVLHGDWRKDAEKLSVDLYGQVLVRNDTSSTFDDAVIWLADHPLTAPPKAPGFLILEPGPLSLPWRESPPEFLPCPPRRVGEGLQLPARSRQAFPLVVVHRIPAMVLYRLETGVAVPGTLGHPVCASRYLVVPRLLEHGVTLPLPPGPVRLFRGTATGIPLGEGTLSLASGSDEVRLFLGRSDSVTAVKQEVSRKEIEPGRYRISCRIMVRNDTRYPARVEILDTPADTGWEMFSYAHACERRGDRALFELSLPARSRRMIRYTVVSTRPVPVPRPGR